MVPLNKVTIFIVQLDFPCAYVHVKFYIVFILILNAINSKIVYQVVNLCPSFLHFFFSSSLRKHCTQAPINKTIFTYDLYYQDLYVYLTETFCLFDAVRYIPHSTDFDWILNIVSLLTSFTVRERKNMINRLKLYLISTL